MAVLIVAGLDPSLSNWGQAKGVLDLDTGTFRLNELDLQETSPDNKNRKSVRKNSDDLNRAKLLYTTMSRFLIDVDMVFVEIPVGSQSARSMASYGICIGVLASIGKPVIQVTPAEVKLVATGNKNASKAAMIDWAVKKYPDANWFTKVRNGVTTHTAKNEHLADATACIHAGVKTDEFSQARAILNSK